MKRIIYISALTLFICFGQTSCSSKTPEEYAKEYCNCMTDHNQNMKKCKHILDDAKSDYGTDNKEAREKFISAYNECSSKD